MGKDIICSRDDCDARNVNADVTVYCAKCKGVIHLPCFGITKAAKDLFVHRNIKMFCFKCVPSDTDDSLPVSPPPPQTTQLRKTATGSKTTSSTKMQPTLAQLANDKKISEIHSLLKTVDTGVKAIELKLSSNDEQSKLFSDVLKKVNVNTMSTKEMLSEKNKRPLFSNVASRMGISSPSSFPQLQTPSKRKRPDASPISNVLRTKPQPFANRKLISGTSAITSDKLGAPVALSNTKRSSPFAHLTKSIYVSRLQPTVTPEQILGYLKEKIPDIDEKDISLRLLVKKEQREQLDSLSFVSYRLSCTDDNYAKLMDPSFWPAHVKIGEFFERPRQRIDLAEFASPLIEKMSDKKASSAPNDLENTNPVELVRIENLSEGMETN